MFKVFPLFCWRTVFLAAVLTALATGIFLRIYNLWGSGFFFYDEGLYLNHNLPALEMIRKYQPQGGEDNWRAFLFYLKMALGSGKSLWFLIIDSRFLWGGIHAWGFAKIAACFFGLLLLLLTYFFSKKFYGSRDVAFLSVAIVSLLPGAVFYSRIALQEALSMVLVLGGFYVYLFARRWGWRSALSGVILAAAFFSNYRLLMLPVLVLASEIWMAFSEKRAFSIRQYVWFCVAFFSCVVVVGSALDAVNMRVVFSWVFHQEQMASQQFSWVNLLSYPYYFFRLETWPFAVSILGAMAYLLWRQKWLLCLPVVLVLVQMGIFSLTSEKGARYIAVILPFAGMSVAYLFISLWNEFRGGMRYVPVLFAIVLFILMAGKSWDLAQASSAHEKAVRELLLKDPGARMFSSQELVDVLYVQDKADVQAIPRDFQKLSEGFSDGFRYLILDPQAYVTQTRGAKFTAELRDYLNFFDRLQVPARTYPHMNRAFLDRFVLEHSEYLPQSVRFINDPDAVKFSSLRVYDLSRSVPQMRRFVDLMKVKKP